MQRKNEVGTFGAVKSSKLKVKSYKFVSLFQSNTECQKILLIINNIF